MASADRILPYIGDGGTPITKRMELFHVAFLRTLCAQNGYALNVYDFDFESVDCTIKSFEGRKVSLDLQLKATAQDLISGDHIAYPVPIENYERLIESGRESAIAFSVLLLPGYDVLKWAATHDDGILLKAKLYYKCIMGEKMPPNKTSKTVHVPLTNHVTGEELRRLMERLDRDEEI